MLFLLMSFVPWCGSRCMVYRSAGPIQRNKHVVVSSSGSLVGRAIFCFSLWLIGSPYCFALTRADVPSSRVTRENMIATGGRFALLSVEVGEVGEERSQIETGWLEWGSYSEATLHNRAGWLICLSFCPSLLSLKKREAAWDWNFF